MIFLHVNEKITRFTIFLYMVSRELETAMIISHEMPHFTMVTFQELFIMEVWNEKQNYSISICS